MDIHDEENPDMWDYSMAHLCVTIITILVGNIITYRKRIAMKKN